MKKPPVLYYSKNPSEFTHSDLVFKYQDMANNSPTRLTPVDQIDKWQTKAHFREAPMLLSPGEWTVHKTLALTKPSLKITGAGYHTVFKASKVNTSGILSIAGEGTRISGIRFLMDTYGGGKVVEVLDNANGVTISNCAFFCTQAAYGVYANLASNLTIENCYFTSGTNDVIYVLDSNNVVIRNNRIIPGSGVEINLASTTAGTVGDQSNFGIVLGNHVGAGSIRYNTTATSGNHQISGNNANATLVTY
jgi:hypothetical protein